MIKIKQDDPTRHEISMGRQRAPAYVGEGSDIKAAYKMGHVTVTIDLTKLNRYVARALHAKTGKCRLMKGAVTVTAEGVDTVLAEELE